MIKPEFWGEEPLRENRVLRGGERLGGKVNNRVGRDVRIESLLGEGSCLHEGLWKN